MAIINTILDDLERRAEIGERRKRRERKERGETKMRGWRGELTRQSHGTHTHGENLYMESLGALCKVELNWKYLVEVLNAFF